MVAVASRGKTLSDELGVMVLSTWHGGGEMMCRDPTGLDKDGETSRMEKEEDIVGVQSLLFLFSKFCPMHTKY